MKKTPKKTFPEFKKISNQILSLLNLQTKLLVTDATAMGEVSKITDRYFFERCDYVVKGRLSIEKKGMVEIRSSRWIPTTFKGKVVYHTPVLIPGEPKKRCLSVFADTGDFITYPLVFEIHDLIKFTADPNQPLVLVNAHKISYANGSPHDGDFILS